MVDLNRWGHIPPVGPGEVPRTVLIEGYQPTEGPEDPAPPAGGSGVVRVQAFQAVDGALFSTEADCRVHNGEVARKERCTSFWRVSHMPDLEDDGSHRAVSLFEVFRDPGLYEDAMTPRWIEDFCFRSYGRPIVFTRGGSPVEAWVLDRIDRRTFESRGLSGLCERSRLVVARCALGGFWLEVEGEGS